jgi:hypothetical protein
MKLGVLVILTVLGGTACQTTNLAARAGDRKNAAQCARVEDRRSDCEDLVGCYWDYDSSRCQSH